MDDGPKYVLYGGTVVGGIALGYYALRSLFAGSSCTTPGSACFTAAKPYLDAWQICANQYAADLKQYYAENNTAGIGLTSTQLSNLQYLTDCMNMNAAAAGKAAIAANPSFTTIIQNVLESWGGYIIAGVLAYKLITSLPSVITKIRSGSNVANALKQRVTQDAIDDGTITAASATAEITGTQTLAQDITTSNSSFFAELATADIIVAQEADMIISQDALTLADDEVAIEEALSLL